LGGRVFGKKVSLRTTSQLRWDVVKNRRLPSKQQHRFSESFDCMVDNISTHRPK
jgi:hypothetical protein